MIILSTKILGVKVIQSKIYKDSRDLFKENYRSRKHEVSLLWNDKDLKIKWPIKNPIISKKYKNNLKFEEYKELYLKK
jgi:dTDP-4-dehydrorhamnose 3,5-epimerase-like enzyme